MPVVMKAEYDPKGLNVKIVNESEPKEFIVSKMSEFVRIGAKSLLFKLSTESLLCQFPGQDCWKDF